TQFGFQQLNLAAERRLSNMKPFGRPGETAFLCHGHEITDLPEFHRLKALDSGKPLNWYRGARKCLILQGGAVDYTFPVCKQINIVLDCDWTPVIQLRYGTHYLFPDACGPRHHRPGRNPTCRPPHDSSSSAVHGDHERANPDAGSPLLFRRHG